MSEAPPSPSWRLWRSPRTGAEWLVAALLTIGLLSVGLPVLRSGPGQDAAAARLHTHGVEVTARITKVVTTGADRGPRVDLRFTTATGEVVEADDQQPAGTYAVGLGVAVVYDPTDPQRVAFGTRDDVDTPEPFWLALGGSLTALGAWQLLRTLLGVRLVVDQLREERRDGPARRG